MIERQTPIQVLMDESERRREHARSDAKPTGNSFDQLSLPSAQVTFQSKDPTGSGFFSPSKANRFGLFGTTCRDGMNHARAIESDYVISCPPVYQNAHTLRHSILAILQPCATSRLILRQSFRYRKV